MVSPPNWGMGPRALLYPPCPSSCTSRTTGSRISNDKSYQSCSRWHPALRNRILHIIILALEAGLLMLGALSRTGSVSPQTGSGSSSRNVPRGRPPPSLRLDSERPVLPPDAVDLVVEDLHLHAAETEMTHERRKVEPAVRVGAPRLHRVYRHGYVVEEEDGLLQEEGEVEVAPPPEQARGVFDIGEEDPAPDEALDLERHAHAMEETARTAARAETPPLHARVIVDVPDDNPWA